MKRPTKLLIAALPVVLAGGGWWLWMERYEDTDNAYTAAHVATLSPKVSGLVTEVFVEENTRVKKDQVLVRIDRRDYVNALQALVAERGELEASLVLAEKDYRRSSRLFAERAGTEQDRDEQGAKLEELRKKNEALLARIAQAELNLGFTELRAPSDGTIGKKLAEPGMVVSAGQPLLSFVDAQTPWVVANFKETQLRKMQVGQRVELAVDSIDGRKFEGEIESFSPGTGATFALIPPENATGNFTKIVQRLPVRIRFVKDSVRGYEERIVPGLSVEATVDLHSVEGVQAPVRIPQTELTLK
jgi:membrane fusion protein (multidrug efflux system)